MKKKIIVLQTNLYDKTPQERLQIRTKQLLSKNN